MTTTYNRDIFIVLPLDRYVGREPMIFPLHTILKETIVKIYILITSLTVDVLICEAFNISVYLCNTICPTVSFVFFTKVQTPQTIGRSVYNVLSCFFYPQFESSAGSCVLKFTILLIIVAMNLSIENFML